MSTTIIFSVCEYREGGYEARALGHSIFTHADNMDELRAMIRDAVDCHFESDSRPSAIHVVLAEN